MNSGDILYHITVASKPEELVETCRGKLSYRQWCESEIARINRKGNWGRPAPIALYENPKTGEISVAHLRVTAR